MRQTLGRRHTELVVPRCTLVCVQRGFPRVALQVMQALPVSPTHVAAQGHRPLEGPLDCRLFLKRLLTRKLEAFRNGDCSTKRHENEFKL